MTAQQRIKCFEVRIPRQQEVEYTVDDIHSIITDIPNTEILATIYKQDAYYYLIYSEIPRRVHYYNRRIKIGTVIPYKMEPSPVRTVTKWLYIKE